MSCRDVIPSLKPPSFCFLGPAHIHTPPIQTLGFSFKAHLHLCTLRFASNRVVSGFLPPDGVLSQQDKTAPLARSEPNKTSSSFDRAINKDNKDFDYANQRRGY
ncbi:uncharacterized protein LOC113565992 [Drosophila persimilis]|uniref:uncharacterized protein LOC113565992 n=1 Tax=Drosophila persimilis TaxID=7234 RepID=UPI000F09175F|nr:uncharacterized protein LOC113565992 [Drosophila persimilis]